MGTFDFSVLLKSLEEIFSGDTNVTYSFGTGNLDIIEVLGKQIIGNKQFREYFYE
jgi:hypothetical protein